MRSPFKHSFSLVTYLVFPLLGAGLVLTASLYLYLSPKLPSVETLKSVKFQTPLRVYSQDLKLIGEFGEKRRTPVVFEDIPLLFIQAVLAAEDASFYQHIGVDFKGLTRASLELLRTGSIQTGGSTITMQLARNFFLSREQSFIRKFNEILLALRIEDELTKDDIFTLYANKIYLGNRAYGIQAAALTYYGQTIDTLPLAHLAMIAGLPKAPSAFNPIINPERAMSRRDWILRRMLKLGYIGTMQYEAATNTPIAAQYHGPSIDYNAPYAAEQARAEAISQLGTAAYSDGYRVITTIDSELQSDADRAVRNGLQSYDWRHGYRGPEANIGHSDRWTATLNSTPAIGGLAPAIVTAVTADSLTLMTRTTGVLTLTKADKGLANLRAYLSENSRGAVVKDLTKAFSQGDLVRLGQYQNEFYLAQLPAAQAALVALDPDSGAIRAISGGFDFYQSHFNRVTQGKRQPGSNFKPFIYTAALENGMTPATMINDAPVVFDNGATEKAWRPENNSGEFYGPTPLRRALYLSRNLVSIRVLRTIGIDAALNTVDKFGFNKDELPRDLSLALGSHALTPLQIATGYASFANGGYKISPYLVERIETADGDVVFGATNAVVCRDCETDESGTPQDIETAAVTAAASIKSAPGAIDVGIQEDPAIANTSLARDVTGKPPADRIIEPRVAYLIDSMLKDVVARGTGTKARALKRQDIGGKTGTTNGPRDAWFSGYNPDLVTTVWLGFDDNKLLGRREFGGSAALPIWIDFMGSALAGKAERFRPQPDGLVTVKINPESGMRASANTGNAVFELFREENVPDLPEALAAPVAAGQKSTPLPEDIF